MANSISIILCAKMPPAAVLSLEYCSTIEICDLAASRLHLVDSIGPGAEASTYAYISTRTACVRFSGDLLKSLCLRPPTLIIGVSIKKGGDFPSRTGSIMDVLPSAADVTLESGMNSTVRRACCFKTSASVASEG